MSKQTNPEIILDIKPRGIVSAYVSAPFDVGKDALENQEYSIIFLEENAGLRIQEGKDAYVSRNGNWVKEDVIYVPNKGKFLTKNSPIMENPKQATDCQRNGKEFYLTDEQVEQSLEDSVFLSQGSIPTNRFGDDAITNYAFGKYAKEYGDFLRENKIDEMPVWTADIKDKPFARKMWFGGRGYRSVLGGNYRGLNYYDRARGVLNSAEGTQKIIGMYYLDEISKTLNKKGITGKLEQEIIESLKQ